MDLTQTQPTPDAPKPPTVDHATRARWMSIAATIASLIVIAALLLGALNMTRTAPGLRLALAHAQDIGVALHNFDADYHSFPDASTAAAVAAKTATPLTLGSASSNQLFRQLLVTMSFPTEEIFWAETVPKLRKPDNIFTSDSSALVRGECGFAYIAGHSHRSAPDTPVAVSSLLPGKLLFDPAPFRGWAIILQAAGNAYATEIDPAGHVMVGGMDIFDPKQPFWHGKAPDIKWPE